MPAARHEHLHHRHFALTYPKSPWENVYSIFLLPLLLVVAVLLLYRGPAFLSMTNQPAITFGYLAAAFLQTFLRLLIAYALSLVIAVPLAILAHTNPWVERLVLPLFDILQSVPVLAFFPLIIAFFLQFGLYNASAIFILFLTMLWSIVFSIVGGLKVIPGDIQAAAVIFRLQGWQYLRRLLLPAIVPYLVTGSLLAWAQGWNIIIVAEVLRTYIPQNANVQDLFGIGSLMVHAAAMGKTDMFVVTVGFLVAAIALLNFFVWQQLLHYAERFRFD